MSSTHGLKGKVEEIVRSMDALRTHPEQPQNVTLREHLARNYSENGKPLTPEHLYSELGIHPNYTRVKDVYADKDTAFLMAEIVRDGVRRGLGEVQRQQMEAARRAIASFAPATYDGGRERFMSPEVFTDPVRRGVVQSVFYPDLTVREEPVSQPTVTVPKIELSDATLKDTGEAATIEEGSVTYGSKDVKVKTKGRALKVSYESIQFNSLSLAQIWFEDAGRILGHTLNNMAVEAIADGDQEDGSEAAAVIGVANTTNGITWFDLARVAIQFGVIGRTGLQAIGNATTALNYINLDEVKNKQFPGAALLQTMVKTPLQMPEELYASLKVGANKLIIQDPSMSLVQLTAQSLMIETDKIIIKRLFENVASIMTGFAKLQRNASVVIDGSIAFSGAGFPAWMQPFDE